MGKRVRPILQRPAIPGLDPRTRTRRPTAEEVGLARYALKVLGNERLVVSLAPAPDPHFDGHMIRVVDCRNPHWYRDLQSKHRYEMKRVRVVRALERVVVQKRVRGNGYEVELLKLFKELRNARGSR
jgi:hypothetical protein